jgi:hypothetical protein
MLRSHPTLVFVLKLWAPIILFLGSFVFWMSKFRWGQLVILIPLFLGMFFHLSFAEMQIPDGKIRFRRLFKWKKLAYDEIVGCGVTWGGGIGYLRLKRFLLPWGKLYFVLDANEKLFGRGTHPLLRFIQEHIEP